MSEVVTTPRPRGRPKSPSKRLAIISAAKELFLEHGVDGVSLDVVIAKAAVSKTTFYANFSDRTKLFEAVIESEAQNLMQVNTWISDRCEDLQEDLLNFGYRSLQMLMCESTIGIERMMGKGSAGKRELAEFFFAAGPGRVLKVLVDRIELGMKAGDLRADDPERAASDLMALWIRDLRVKVGIGLIDPPDDEALMEYVTRGVSLFMKLYGDVD